MEFLKVEDVQNILRCSKSYAYKVIRELSEEFKEEFKDARIVRARIPRWFFEKKYKIREEN